MKCVWGSPVPGVLQIPINSFATSKHCLEQHLVLSKATVLIIPFNWERGWKEFRSKGIKVLLSDHWKCSYLIRKETLFRYYKRKLPIVRELETTVLFQMKAEILSIFYVQSNCKYADF